MNAVCSHKRSEEHTSELQSRFDLVCRLLLEKKMLKEHVDGLDQPAAEHDARRVVEIDRRGEPRAQVAGGLRHGLQRQLVAAGYRPGQSLRAFFFYSHVGR